MPLIYRCFPAACRRACMHAAVARQSCMHACSAIVFPKSQARPAPQFPAEDSSLGAQNTRRAALGTPHPFDPLLVLPVQEVLLVVPAVVEPSIAGRATFRMVRFRPQDRGGALRTQLVVPSWRSAWCARAARHRRHRWPRRRRTLGNSTRKEGASRIWRPYKLPHCGPPAGPGEGAVCLHLTMSCGWSGMRARIDRAANLSILSALGLQPALQHAWPRLPSAWSINHEYIYA